MADTRDLFFTDLENKIQSAWNAKSETLSKKLKATQVPDVKTLVDQIWTQCQTIIKQYEANPPKGVSAFATFVFASSGDLIVLYNELTQFMSVQDRKALIISTIQYLADKIPLNIPWVPSWTVKPVENFIINTILPLVLDVIFSKFVKTA